MANNVTIRIDKHTSFKKSFQWLDASEAPVVITDYNFIGQIRKTAADDAELYAEFSFTKTDASLGKFDMELTIAQTSAIPSKHQTSSQKDPSQYSFDVKAIDSLLKSTILIEGVAMVFPSPTQV
jgi:hypothetical protein